MENYIDKDLETKLVRIRRNIHSKAEVGFNLQNTRRLVTEELEGLGCEVKSLGNGCIYTVIEGERKGKLKVAKNMLKKDIKIDDIIEITGLTKEEIII